jgi:hypothetical protein
MELVAQQTKTQGFTYVECTKAFLYSHQALHRLHIE